MTVNLNEALLHTFLRSPDGPVGRYTARKVDAVRARAEQNATNDGPTGLQRDTGDLLGNLTANIAVDGQGLYGTVGTTAIHRGFNYPAYWDQNGRPWLSKALQDEFQ